MNFFAIKKDFSLYTKYIYIDERKALSSEFCGGMRAIHQEIVGKREKDGKKESIEQYYETGITVNLASTRMPGGKAISVLHVDRTCFSRRITIAYNIQRPESC